MKVTDNSTQELRRLWVVCLLLANLIFAVIYMANYFGGFQSTELLAKDMAMRIWPTAPVDERITLIGFTEPDIRKYGYPASDELLSRVLERLTQANASAIGVDIYRDIPVPPGGARLDTVLKANPNIIWITRLHGSDDRVHAPAVIDDTDQIGFNDMVVDSGGIIRRGLLFMDDGKNYYFSLPLRLSMPYLSSRDLGLAADPDDPNLVRLGKTTIIPFEKNDGGYVDADAGGYQFLLDYQGMPGKFPKYSFEELLTGKVPEEQLTDKIIIIGASANSVNDSVFTPFGHSYDGAGLTLGMEVHGMVVSQLLRLATGESLPTSTISGKLEAFYIWFWIMLGALWGILARNGLRASIVGSLMAMLIVALFLAADANSIWIPVAAPLTGFLVTSGTIVAYMATYLSNRSRFIKETFGRYLADDVVEHLLEHPEGLNLGGQTLTVSVMFTDLRGFTALSERLEPEAVVNMLNNYLETMTEIIFRHGGNVNDIMGDGIMVLFGAPTATEDDAARSVACAIEMQIAMEKVNEYNAANELPPLEMGIGINTGPAVAGNLGSEMHAKYTVIGSHVNLAARVETLTVGGQVLITETTRDAIESPLIITNESRHPVKGFTDPIGVFEVKEIGAPYNLVLPKEQIEFHILDEALPVSFELVDGKSVSEDIEQGRLTSLAAKSAKLETDIELADGSSIRLHLGADSPEQPIAYAKVMSHEASGEFEIHFTSLPYEAFALLDALQSTDKA